MGFLDLPFFKRSSAWGQTAAPESQGSPAEAVRESTVSKVWGWWSSKRGSGVFLLTGKFTNEEEAWVSSLWLPGCSSWNS